MNDVVTSVNTMVSDVATAALGLITTNVPVVAPVIGGMILIGFGLRLSKRLFNRS